MEPALPIKRPLASIASSSAPILLCTFRSWAARSADDAASSACHKIAIKLAASMMQPISGNIVQVSISSMG
jgi:hypothetical protein